MFAPSNDYLSLTPCVKASICLHAISREQLLVLSQQRRSILKGKDLVHVAALIDGKRSVREIIAALGNMFNELEVLNALDYLQKKACVVVGDDYQPSPETALWESVAGGAADGTVPSFDGTNEETAITIENWSGVTCESLAQVLVASGAKLESGSRMRIVLIDHIMRADFSAISAAMSAANSDWLLVSRMGANPSIGPFFSKNEGPCADCLRHWILGNRPVEHWLMRAGIGHAQFLPDAHAPCADYALFGMVALTLGKMLRNRQFAKELRHTLWQLDLTGMKYHAHHVQKRPQCPTCGDRAWMQEQAYRPLKLSSAPIERGIEGGYRSVDPNVTYERYRHLISPVTGAICYLHTMPGRHAGMRKVYVAGYMVCPSQPPTGNAFDKICAGKGQSDEQARASALCEALERYSGVYQGDEAVVRGNMHSVGNGRQAIHFNALQNFSDTQFADRERINSLTDDRRKQIPEPFTETSEIDWTPAWSLVTNSLVYVPLTYCYAEAPWESGGQYGIHNPNGAAAGNCIEEAVLQGFLELVERDAVAIWWYNKLRRASVNLMSFRDAYFQNLCDQYRALGWELHVLNLTLDLRIPVFAALAIDPINGRRVIGFGAHLDARLAVQRALTEVNQLFDPSQRNADPWDRSLLGDESFLLPDPDQSPVLASEFQSSDFSDLAAALEYCINLVRELGCNFLVVNKTRPDIGLPVVQVIVPGLRHFWPRFGPGRLYDVAPAIGLSDRRILETELNRAPLFL